MGMTSPQLTRAPNDITNWLARRLHVVDSGGKHFHLVVPFSLANTSPYLHVVMHTEYSFSWPGNMA